MKLRHVAERKHIDKEGVDLAKDKIGREVSCAHRGKCALAGRNVKSGIEYTKACIARIDEAEVKKQDPGTLQSFRKCANHIYETLMSLEAKKICPRH